MLSGRVAGLNATTGSNNIYLGTNVFGTAGESNTMYLGRVGTQTTTVIAGVRGTSVAGGEIVMIDANGRLGSAPAGAPGANSVGTNEVIDDSLTAADLAPDSVGASEVAFNYAGSSSEGGAASNADLLDGIDSTAFALAGHGHDVSQVTNAARLASNTFTATQTIDTGNLDLDNSTATTGNITKSGQRFLHNFGTANTFLGADAGNFTLTGTFNTGTGISALKLNSTGSDNTATGAGSLTNNTAGSFNTAVGRNALLNNATGQANTAVGRTALANSTADFNTAVGNGALVFTTTGASNVAVGFNAGGSNTTGSNNIYLGANADGAAAESNTMRLGHPAHRTGHSLAASAAPRQASPMPSPF